MKKLRAIFHNENGSIMVIVAIAIASLLGATAMAVDIGRVYHQKSILQAAMDAAALGGAQGLLSSEVHAAVIAKDIANKNSFAIDDTNLTITTNSIKTSRTSTVPMVFAKAIGINEATIGASAKAKIAHVKSSGGVAPIAVEKSIIPGGTKLTCEKMGEGNCGFLDLDANGASGLKERILNGGNVSEGSFVDTEPGHNLGPVKDAITTLIENDKDKLHCQSPKEADNSCDRVIIVVIINSWAGINGKKPVKVEGLAAYWVKQFNDETKEIEGNFMKMVTFGEVGGSSTGTLYGVTLVE